MAGQDVWYGDWDQRLQLLGNFIQEELHQLLKALFVLGDDIRPPIFWGAVEINSETGNWKGRVSKHCSYGEEPQLEHAWTWKCE